MTNESFPEFEGIAQIVGLASILQDTLRLKANRVLSSFQSRHNDHYVVLRILQMEY